MKPDMTGFQRLQFTLEWVKRGRPPTKEDFITKCCETLNLQYVPPPDLKRARSVTKSANMFPGKK